LVQVPEDEKTWRLAEPTGGAADCQVVPLLVSKFPDAPGATAWKVDVPLPSRTLLAVKVAAPVPPLATGKVPVTPVVSETLLIVLFKPLMVLLVNV
jgi:hypothetical protein